MSGATDKEPETTTWGDEANEMSVPATALRRKSKRVDRAGVSVETHQQPIGRSGHRAGQWVDLALRVHRVRVDGLLVH